MSLLHNISIKQKLRLMITITSGIAVVLACAVFVWIGTTWFSHQTEGNLATMALWIHYSSETALDFGEPGNCQQIIDSLNEHRDIVAGCLYSTDGKTNGIIARYARQGMTNLPPAQPLPDGFHSTQLEYVKSIVNRESGQKVGTVYLRYDDEVKRRFLWSCLSTVLAGVIFASLASFALSARFQRPITEPIFQLLRTAKIVSEQKNYSVRATPYGHDELGQLVNGFNEMLEQIQSRDQQLQKHREHLEEEVAERTQELTNVNRDLISAKEKAEEARLSAEQANRAKSNFLSFMSHELRTPLTAINGFSEMMLSEVEEEGRLDWADDLRRINDSGKYLLELINDILDISKIEAGKMEVYLETFDPALVIRDVTNAIRPLVEKRKNRLLVDGLENLGQMHADLIKLRQCLLNVLSNANKFTEQGIVTVSAKREASPNGDRVIFKVTDTGIGMTKEQMGKLFRAFTQADDSTSRKYGGTGLGLALTKQFCLMMDGSISVESEPGKGSTFTIKLPAAVRQRGPIAYTVQPGTPLSARQNSTNCILVIDDDPAVRQLLDSVLRPEGYRLEFASSGSEGLRCAKEIRPALITLDVLMPGMDGWMVLSLLKADPDLANIPVIMLTVSPEQDFGFAMGVAEFLKKPIDRDRLIAVLKKYPAIQPGNRVLVVEDDPGMRAMLSRMLEKEELSIVEAENGAAALESVSRCQPSLIILDLMMPVMDGFQFVAELQRRPEWRKIPVVVVSAKELTQEDRQRLQGHVKVILQKGSFARDELIREVREKVSQFLSVNNTAAHNTIES